MLSIRDLGINVLSIGGEDHPVLFCTESGGGTEECPDMTCGAYYKRPTKKKPAKKKPTKKAPPKKKPAKKAPSKKRPTKKRRTSGFGTAVDMLLQQRLEEQLRNEH